MPVVEEYLEKDKEYKRKFGNRTFLLYQVGVFFEVYGLENHESFENVKTFSDI